MQTLAQIKREGRCIISKIDGSKMLVRRLAELGMVRDPLPGLVVEVGGVVGQHIGEYRIHFRIGTHRGKILGSQHPVHDGLSPELSAVFGQQLFDSGHPFGRPVEICSQECAGNQADNLGQVVVAGVVKGFGIEPFFLVDVISVPLKLGRS